LSPPLPSSASIKPANTGSPGKTAVEVEKETHSTDAITNTEMWKDKLKAFCLIGFVFATGDA